MMKGTRIRLEIMLALLAVVLSTFLVACGGIGAASDKTTITWLVRTTDPGLAQWEQQVVNDFEKQNPKITVQMIKVPNTSYDQKILTAASGGTPIDVFSQWGSDSWVDFAYRNLAADLSPYVQSSHFDLSGMNQKLLDQYRVGNKLYGIPFSTGGSYLFYNINLLQKAHLPTPPSDWNDPSWTWSKVQQYAQAMSVHSNNAAQRQFGMSDDLFPENANALLFGGDIFNQQAYTTGVVNSVDANSSAVEQAVQWQHDLVYKYQVAPTPAEGSALSNGFMSGKIGMDLTGVWGFWVYKNASFKWGVAPMPTFKTDNSYLFTDPWMMAKGSKHPQQAWAFLKYLVDPQEGAKSYTIASGAPSPWNSLAETWADNTHNTVPSMSTQQLTQLYQGSLSHCRESINHLAIGYSQYDNIINNVLAPVFNGKGSAETSVNDLQKQLTDAISRNGNVKPLQ
jgi:multiple sugar transport system substrate-binding protein